MIRINLLPKTKQPSMWPSGEHVLLASALTYFSIIILLVAVSYYRVWDLQTQVAQIEQNQLLLKMSSANMETASEKRQEIETKTKLLLKLTDERVSFHSVLSHVSAILPPQVWLTEISTRNNNQNSYRETQRGSSSSFVVNLKGRALTYNDIAAFMQKLEQDEYFSGVVLVKAERINSSNDSQFEIAAQIR